MSTSTTTSLSAKNRASSGADELQQCAVNLTKTGSAIVHGQKGDNELTESQRPTRCLSVSKTCIVLRFDNVISVIKTPPCLAFTCVSINHAPSGIAGNEKLPCASH